MASWRGFWKEGRKFWEVAEATHDSSHTSQAASSAILAAIAYNDAICLLLARRKPQGDSHTAAAGVLRDACRGTQWEREAPEQCKRLTYLVEQKSTAQYHGRPLPPDDAETIMKQTKRFVEWAEELLSSPSSSSA